MIDDQPERTLDLPVPDDEPTPVITRRTFLTGVAGGVLLTGLAACSSRTAAPEAPTSTDTSTSNAAGGQAGAAFAQPDELVSSDGVLEVALRAEAMTLPWDGGQRYALTYNGMSPGPTLRVRPGDRLQIRLENRLDEPTNLHTHGLHVSPDGDSDNVFVSVAPGEEHTYTYEIPPDHRSGTFWYHPHAHGAVARQVFGGLAGAIIVTDAVDDDPALANSTERVLVLADPRIGGGSEILDTGHMDQMMGREGNAVLVNGLLAPEVPAVAGELERWRVINASASRYYRLAVDGHDLHVVATDGGRLSAPVAVTDVLLTPGERTELLIVPSAAGSYAVRSLTYDRGSMGMGGMSGVSDETTIATMTVTGDARSEDTAALPSELEVGDHRIPEPTNNRTLELGMGMAGGMGGGMVFTIDGKTFDHDRTDISAATGTVEQWEIINTTTMDHPFHLHVWPFRVVNDQTLSGWKDTVNVPAGGSVQIVVPFSDMVGRTVYHCHILDHEDLGMMGTIEVRSS